jgi:hypothetical protein
MKKELFKPNEIGKGWGIESDKRRTAHWAETDMERIEEHFRKYPIWESEEIWKPLQVAIVPLRIWRKILKELKEEK